ncbi:regulator of G-protein signaling 9-binding protein [Megalops cyprinoides]|uniref:regulator of G-protein signaling 9-binding protein n=1 Tax=Megalops cyprinoides TaxID=118141 RepID=UPI001864D74E|nr:regulator of G-protein signaling 9-binding protein [Megalops cyprinoides]
MTLSNNKVANDDNASSSKAVEEAKALVDALNKVVACYRHLAACVGGCTDGANLRDELRRTRERAQELALANRQRLTTSLRDKSLPTEERLEMELLWVAFSSSLELFHADMCKVFDMGHSFSLSKASAFVQTGIQGETTEVAARALSLPDLNRDETPASVERLEQTDLEVEIARVDQMIEEMEQKVSVLRWTVEARGPQYADPASTDSASLALLSGNEEDPSRCCDRSQMFVTLLLCGVAAVAVALSVCVVYLA